MASASASVKIALVTAWAALVGYAFLAAPPADPVLEPALWHLRFGGIDPSIVAVFLLLGMNADLYIVLLLRDGRFGRVPGWPFGVAMMLLGSFILIPYLVLRHPRVGRQVPAGRVTRVLSSRPIGWVIALGICALLAWGIGAGHAAAFTRAFYTSGLVNVMTIDCVLEIALLWLLIAEQRRLDPPFVEPAIARAVRWLPLVGPALWNALVVHDPPTSA